MRIVSRPAPCARSSRALASATSVANRAPSSAAPTAKPAGGAAAGTAARTVPATAPAATAAARHASAIVLRDDTGADGKRHSLAPRKDPVMKWPGRGSRPAADRPHRFRTWGSQRPHTAGARSWKMTRLVGALAIAAAVLGIAASAADALFTTF